MAFSTETIQGKRECDGVLKRLKENGCQLRTLYSAKVSFKSKGEMAFSKWTKSEFITTRPALQEMLNGVLWVEVK